MAVPTVRLGDEFQVTAAPFLSDGTPKNFVEPVTWESTDVGVLEIINTDPSGNRLWVQVRAKKVGAVVLRSTSSGVTHEDAVTVIAPFDEIRTTWQKSN